jgi:hypothetical protein
MKTRKIVSIGLIILGILIIIIGILNLFRVNDFSKDTMIYIWSEILIPLGIILIWSGYLVNKGNETHLAKALGY